MSNRYIEIESAKGIKNPIQMRMDLDSDKIFWNIRFNIPLNPDTVNPDNMDVTDVEGFILTSNIKYDPNTNAIIINPIEPYKPNATYILNVSTNVCSKGNNNLKEEVQIVFRLKGAEISSFKILKGKDRLDIDIKPSRVMPTEAQRKKDKLPSIAPGINFWVAIGALIFFLVTVFTKVFALLVAGIVVMIIGIAHIVYQLVNAKAASMRLYNKGVQLYNVQQFADARELFEQALAKDPENNFAQRAMNRLAYSPDQLGKA